MNSLRLTWTDTSNDETSFDIFRSPVIGGASPTFVFVASVPANAVEFTDTGLSADTTYEYEVRAVRGDAYSAFNAAWGRTQAVTAIGEWTGSDIPKRDYPSVGDPAGGSYSGTPPAVTLNAVGYDIAANDDAFGYYYRTLAGDATIVTRVASLTETSNWAKAGVLIRGTLDRNSAQVSMLLAAEANAIFEVRALTGAYAETPGPWVSAPYWVKLTRVGDTFTGYISPDGATWTQVGMTTLVLPSTVYVGVAASPHANARTTAVFDHLAATGNTAPPPPAPPAAPTNLVFSNVTTGSVQLNWIDHANNEEGFEITRQGFAGDEVIGTVAADVTSFIDTGVDAGMMYWYSVKSFKGDQRSPTLAGAYATTPGTTPAPPAVPQDLAIDSATESSVHLTWTDASSDETAFDLERQLSFGGNWVYVATLPPGTTSYTDTSVRPGTGYKYYLYAVRRTVRSAEVTAIAQTLAAGTLPPGSGTGYDIGITGSTGSDSGAPPTVTINAGGSDIYGTADSFRYVAQTMTGDATIVARVASLSNTHPWAKAGVMLRASLDANAANAAMLVSPSEDCSFQARATAGAATQVTTGAYVNAPYWVKLTRVGNVFTGYVSPNGTTWTQVGAATLALPSQLYIGLADCAHNTSALAIATFDHVEMSNYAAPSPPAAPGYLQITAMTASTASLAWTGANSAETGFVLERATGTGAFAAIATVAADVRSYTDTGLSALTSYSYRIRAVRDTDYSAYSITATGQTRAATPPPAPWSGGDIGTTGSTGTDSGTPPTVTMNAGGADIYGTADSFHYAAQAVTGDATIIARVASLTNTNSWAKAGVMIRGSLDASAANAAMFLSPAQVCSFQARPTAGAATQVTTGAYVTPPQWVKLTRVGNLFTGYFSSDGIGWIQVGSATIVLPAQVFIGLAASSHNTSAQTVVSFEQVTVTSAATPPPSEAPAAPSNLTASGSSASNVYLTWTDNSNNEDGFETYRQTGSAPAVLLGTLPANITGADDTSVAPNTTYTYYLKATAGSLRSASSNSVTVTTPSAPPAGVAAPSNLQVDSPTTTSLHLAWTDNASDETGIELERVPSDGSAGATIGLAPNTTQYTDSGLAPDKSYTYRVRAARSGAYSAFSNSVLGRTQAETPPPPSTWSGRDIGTTGSAGTESGSPPTVTMNAGGADIYGTADSFHAMFETVTGDATIVAHVASLTNTNSWAKAGVMIRGSLGADSANAAMLLSPAQVSSFQTRTVGGAATNVTTGAWVNPPYWVKLTRAGDAFTGYVSADGIAWTQVGAATVALPAQVYIGVVGCAHSTAAQTVASFDGVDVAAGSTPPPDSSAWTGAALGSGHGSFSDDGSLSLNGAGADIYGTADAGEHVSRPGNTDGTFVARVSAFTAANSWAKAGLMLRAGPAANAANVFVALTAGQGVVLQSRSAAGGNTVTSAQDWSAGPGAWLKFVRTGTTVSAWWSPNGTSWNALGSVTIDLGASPSLGFAVSSHDSSANAAAVFSDVSVP